MNGGPAFKEQWTAFFNQYDEIRIHFQLTETSMEGTQGVALVEAEMECSHEDPQSSVTPPAHKHAQLRLVAIQGLGGWKFADVQPRTFFS